MSALDEAAMFRSTGGDLQSVVATSEALNKVPEEYRDTVLGKRTLYTARPGLLPDNEIHFYTRVDGRQVRLFKLIIA